MMKITIGTTGKIKVPAVRDITSNAEVTAHEYMTGFLFAINYAAAGTPVGEDANSLN